jgi:hypothetical protein
MERKEKEKAGSSVSDRLTQVERQLVTANKRIAELETKYLALLEDLKLLHVELSKRPTGLTPPLDHQHGVRGPVYTAQFDRWPSQNPDDERLRSAAQEPTPNNGIR